MLLSPNRHLRQAWISLRAPAAQAAMWMTKTGRDPDGAAVVALGAVVAPPALGK